MKDTQTQIEFRIRAYGRTELAQLYCPTLTPGAAYRKLRQWITLSPRPHRPSRDARQRQVAHMDTRRSKRDC